MKELVIRGVALYWPICLMLAVCCIAKPDARERVGALLAWLWAFPALALVNVVAPWSGWWTFHAQGALWWGVPVDLWIGWSVLWGPLAALLPRAWNPALVVAAFLGLVDFALSYAMRYIMGNA